MRNAGHVLKEMCTNFCLGLPSLVRRADMWLARWHTGPDLFGVPFQHLPSKKAAMNRPLHTLST